MIMIVEIYVQVSECKGFGVLLKEGCLDRIDIGIKQEEMNFLLQEVHFLIFHALFIFKIVFLDLVTKLSPSNAEYIC